MTSGRTLESRLFLSLDLRGWLPDVVHEWERNHVEPWRLVLCPLGGERLLLRDHGADEGRGALTVDASGDSNLVLIHEVPQEGGEGPC